MNGFLFLCVSPRLATNRSCWSAPAAWVRRGGEKEEMCVCALPYEETRRPHPFDLPQRVRCTEGGRSLFSVISAAEQQRSKWPFPACQKRAVQWDFGYSCPQQATLVGLELTDFFLNIFCLFFSRPLSASFSFLLRRKDLFSTCLLYRPLFEMNLSNWRGITCAATQSMLMGKAQPKSGIRRRNTPSLGPFRHMGATLSRFGTGPVTKDYSSQRAATHETGRKH